MPRWLHLAPALVASPGPTPGAAGWQIWQEGVMSWAEIQRLAAPVDAPLRETPFAYRFRFSFDPIIVDLLKRHIPWQERAWDAEATCWYTTEDWLETLKRLALAFKDATLVEGRVTTDLHTGRRREQLDLFGG